MTHTDPDRPPEVPSWPGREPAWPTRWFRAVLWAPAWLYLRITASTGRTVAVMLALFLWTTAVIVAWAALNQS